MLADFNELYVPDAESPRSVEQNIEIHEGLEQDVTIDIYIIQLKMPIYELMRPSQDDQPADLPVRVFWTSGTQNYKTQFKVLNNQSDTVSFDEKFRVETRLPLDLHSY